MNVMDVILMSPISLRHPMVLSFSVLNEIQNINSLMFNDLDVVIFYALLRLFTYPYTMYKLKYPCCAHLSEYFNIQSVSILAIIGKDI